MKELIDTIKNFDDKVKKIMIKGLYFSLFTSIVATVILLYYISICHSYFIYYIGIEIMRLAVTFAVSFFASAFVIDKVQKDFN